jgi:hypothetical protein
LGTYCPTLCFTVLLLCVLFTAGAAASDHFFAPAIHRGLDLPPDKVYPQGRLFPFGGYSGIASREAGNHFTLHGPAYGDANKVLLANAEAQGMRAIYTVGIPMNFHEKDGQPALDLSAEEIAAEIKRQVEAVVDSDVIAWWYLVPEELRSWRPKEMEYLEIAARTIRENDPQGRPVWMYDPGHRTASGLAETAQFLDIVGKGMYTNYSGQKGHRVWNRWTIEQQREAIARKGRPGAIQIAVPEMLQAPGPEEIAKIPAWVRHDVYLALVMGAQGVVPYSLATRSGFSSSAWQAYYGAYATIAQEVCGKPGLGEVFLFGERRHDLQVTVTDGEQVVSPTVSSGGITELIEYPSVAMANIAFGSERYLVLVNSSEEPVQVCIDGFPEYPIYARDAFSGVPCSPITSSHTLSLPGLGVVGWRLVQGYVWLASPQPNTAVEDSVIPIEVEAPGILLAEVKVVLDGTTLYEGESLPTSLVLQTADLAAGHHEIVVTVTEQTGDTTDASFAFGVQHFRLRTPLAWAERLRGSILFAFDVPVAPDQLQEASIRLISVSDSGQEYELYTGTSLPPVLSVETTSMEDGAYDLEIKATTVAGHSSIFRQRVVLSNWVTLEDPLLPPVTIAWFGITNDQLKAVARSDGWEFAAERPDVFFGDAHRIRRTSDAEEYLTWQLPQLESYAFTMYARRADIKDRVGVAVSSDGDIWRSVSYTAEVTTQPHTDWLKLELKGSLPAAITGDYVRLTFSGSNAEADALELGHVFLRGAEP